jgi:metal-sulfur cluster biosynthetic enzyme
MGASHPIPDGGEGMNEISLDDAILERLKTVKDPETNTDVIRMRLV